MTNPKDVLFKLTAYESGRVEVWHRDGEPVAVFADRLHAIADAYAADEYDRVDCGDVSDGPPMPVETLRDVTGETL